MSSHAETCPVCNGSGKIGGDKLTGKEPDTCHGCGGKGWVTVQDSPPDTFPPGWPWKKDGEITSCTQPSVPAIPFWLQGMWTGAAKMMTGPVEDVYYRHAGVEIGR